MYNTNTYSLRTSTGALDHELPEEMENDFGTCFRQITYEGEGGSLELYSSSDTEQANSFLPLGYLVEPGDDNEAGAGRPTNTSGRLTSQQIRFPYG